MKQNKDKTKKQIKFSFCKCENVLFALLSVFSVIGLIISCFISCMENISEITIGISCSVLSSSLLAIFMDLIKYSQNKNKLDNNCKAIIENSKFLVTNLNEYLIKTNQNPIIDFCNIESKKIKELDLKSFDTIDELFVINANRIYELNI